MIKRWITVLLLLMGTIAFAQQDRESYDVSQEILYGGNTVEMLIEFSDASLILFTIYGTGGLNDPGLKQLPEHEGFDVARLCNFEMSRRYAKTKTEFYNSIQEQKDQIIALPFQGEAIFWADVYIKRVEEGSLLLGQSKGRIVQEIKEKNERRMQEIESKSGEIFQDRSDWMLSEYNMQLEYLTSDMATYLVVTAYNDENVNLADVHEVNEAGYKIFTEVRLLSVALGSNWTHGRDDLRLSQEYCDMVIENAVDKVFTDCLGYFERYDFSNVKIEFDIDTSNEWSESLVAQYVITIEYKRVGNK